MDATSQANSALLPAFCKARDHAARAFANVDIDRDGFITHDEFLAWVEQMRRAAPPPQPGGEKPQPLSSSRSERAGAQLHSLQTPQEVVPSPEKAHLSQASSGVEGPAATGPPSPQPPSPPPVVPVAASMSPVADPSGPPPLVYTSPPPYYAAVGLLQQQQPQDAGGGDRASAAAAMKQTRPEPPEPASIDLDRSSAGEREILAAAARAQPKAEASAAAAADEARIDEEEEGRHTGRAHRVIGGALREAVSTAGAAFAAMLPVPVGTPGQPNVFSTGFGGVACSMPFPWGSDNAFGGAALDDKEHVFSREDLE